MKKLIAIILVAAMLTTLFAACASKEPAASAAPDKESTAEEKVNVYFIPKNLGNPYFDSMGTGFEEAMEEIGADKFDYTFTGPATAEATSQIEYVDAAVQNGADVIIIDVNSEDALNTTFDEAREAGTTIIVINGDIMGSEEHRDGVIMPCDYGPVGAELIENCGAQIGYKGDFAVLSSTTDAVAQNGWIATMKECLETDEKYKDMNLVEIVYGDDQPEKSTTEAEALITKYPNLSAIIAPTTVGIAAAAKVVQTKGLGEQIKVSGLGMPSEMKEFVLDGTVTSFQLWDPPAEGYLAAYLAYAIATEGWTFEVGKTIEAGKLGTLTVAEGCQLITLPALNIYDIDNIEEYAALF